MATLYNWWYGEPAQGEGAPAKVSGVSAPELDGGWVEVNDDAAQPAAAPSAPPMGDSVVESQPNSQNTIKQPPEPAAPQLSLGQSVESPVGWEPDLSTHPDEWLEAASPEPFVLPSMAKELSKPDAQSEALNNQTLSSSVPPANSSPVEASEPVIRLRGEKIKLNDRPEMVHSSLAASIFNYQSVSSGFLPLEHSRLRNGPKPNLALVVLGLAVIPFAVITTSVWKNWASIVSGFTMLILTTALIGLPLFAFRRIGQAPALIITFIVGHILSRLGFSLWWTLLFASSCVASLFFSSSAVGPGFKVAETKAGRDWVNAAAKTMISFIASMKVPFFDIGEVPPRITGATMVPTTRDNAFDMILNYEYVTNETTKIEIEVPLTLPGLGATKVPVSVSAPQIAGKVRAECRIESCHFMVRSPDDPMVAERQEEKFLALALAFDPIDEIHVGDIRISVAQRFEWLQWFSYVKNQMKTLINGLISTNSVTIYLFDSSFTLLGTVVKPIPKLADAKDFGNIWSVQEAVNLMKTCRKCKRKYFQEGSFCCAHDA